MANLGVTTTSQAVGLRKRKISGAHEKYVDNALFQQSSNVLVLNVDDYHNIHVPQQPNTIVTSRATHMATILMNLCLIPAISCNGIVNPRFIDSYLIMKHLDERFIVNLGVSYHDRIRSKEQACTDEEVLDRLTVHSYDDRLAEKKTDRHIRNSILVDFVKKELKNIEEYVDSLRIVHDHEPMRMYLSNYAVPIVADWPGQYFICKAIAQLLLLNNESIPQFVMSFLPILGPLHVSLNSRELVYKKNYLLFSDVYKSVFGAKKKLGQKPRPWRINLILHIVRLAWSNIADTVYSKFGFTCKNIEFLYLTNLFSNLVPLVLDVYAVHHRSGDWPSYEEACMRCWSDLFLQFNRRNYKRAPLMFFSDVFYWMETGHPIMNLITNHLASLSDSPIKVAHSIIRRRTIKFVTAEQLQKEAHFIFQQRHNNTFQQNFVHSVKYPYTPKQLDLLSQKCSISLLEIFAKVYRNRDIYPIVKSTSDNGINTYELPSLGFEITDRHLPRGFVTSKKPNISFLCDSLCCDRTDDLSNGYVLACGHGYHNYCLQKSHFKCLICLGYLQNEIKKNVDALIVSMTSDLVDVGIFDDRNKDEDEDDSGNADEIIGNVIDVEELLKYVKLTFVNL
ncbi:hypothetical protein C2G38_2182716 [Gigaspora rosea]|uniref:Uncharacterized protein n=1 Tax=Gigaspora rosea TaxID=44941 RepID=A0A397VB13_9GLOM|nr:hypothetical protein C2G38_2182716 [Gigaspora rosea]